MENGKQRANFSSKLGFVFAAASSAVGLGNLWRFPYLAAKYGGGIFLLTYIVLAVLFGVPLLITEIGIGRKTRQSSIGAFTALGQKSNICGILGLIIPMIITPYYCTIGGWVTKYMVTFAAGSEKEAVADSFFGSYIGSTAEPIIFLMIFLAFTSLVVFFGVEKGIEKVSSVLMPVLLVLVVGLSIYICTLPGVGEGVKYYFMPDFSKFSGKLVLAALGQLFYSLSLAMGIMVTYGSYMKKEDNIATSAGQIAFFDSFVALFAGLIIVPSVYLFSNGDQSALSAGPGLMFITLPKVFDTFAAGRIVGFLFFVLVFFAALTSSISLLEAIVSNIMDLTHMGRKKTVLIMTVYCAIVGIFSSLGFGAWSGFTILGFDILDFLDFISNSVLMPVLALFTCIFVGYQLKPENLIAEVEQDGITFHTKRAYRFLVKWFCPIAIVAILITYVLGAFGIFSV
ncbi:MAG: sodium-dependent transporter [Anaerovoracaceae bacterium]|nr:sodium-dependent transporter [Bacillota bacterium]MDY2671254.1 sodium-dependent transporter [Anaerovoracaceae bacterium]